MMGRLFEKRVKATVDGRSVEAINRWFGRCRLMVDGHEVARCDDLAAIESQTPFIEARTEGNTGPLHLSVHLLAVFMVQIELRANGRHLAGARLVSASAEAAQQ